MARRTWVASRCSAWRPRTKPARSRSTSWPIRCTSSRSACAPTPSSSGAAIWPLSGSVASRLSSTARSPTTTSTGWWPTASSAASRCSRTRTATPRPSSSSKRSPAPSGGRAAAGALCGTDCRPVVVPAQTVREDQLDRMRALGIIPSFWATRCFYWGEGHVASTLGRESAYRISPAPWRNAGGCGSACTTIHPSCRPTSCSLLWNAVTRLSRGGEVIGPEQRLTPTRPSGPSPSTPPTSASRRAKGSIEVGKLADMAVLSDNPLRVAPEAIREILVLATLKEGVPIHVLKRGRLPERWPKPPATSPSATDAGRRDAASFDRRHATSDYRPKTALSGARIARRGTSWYTDRSRS